MGIDSSKKLFAIFILLALFISLSLIVYTYLGSRTSKFDIFAEKLLGKEPTIDVRSGNFSYFSYIPDKYTCDGENVNPFLEWDNFPKKTKSFVLLVYDPDAPKENFIHWIVYNIPPNKTYIKEGEDLSMFGIKQGVNDFGFIGYGGPCPPKGSEHRYVFRVIALDTTLNLTEGATIKEIAERIKGHILAYGDLVGLYSR